MQPLFQVVFSYDLIPLYGDQVYIINSVDQTELFTLNGLLKNVFVW